MALAVVTTRGVMTMESRAAISALPLACCFYPRARVIVLCSFSLNKSYNLKVFVCFELQAEAPVEGLICCVGLVGRLSLHNAYAHLVDSRHQG